MLVISGALSGAGVSVALPFQSRNRDACHFRYQRGGDLKSLCRLCFNLAIEMLVISGEFRCWEHTNDIQTFQSRNRDACHFRTDSDQRPRFQIICFNLAIEMLIISGISVEDAVAIRRQCFNLAIEMLIISGCSHSCDLVPLRVSISQSRCLSFQGRIGESQT